jgi:hypothetical protein
VFCLGPLRFLMSTQSSWFSFRFLAVECLFCDAKTLDTRALTWAL